MASARERETVFFNGGTRVAIGAQAHDEEIGAESGSLRQHSRWRDEMTIALLLVLKHRTTGRFARELAVFMDQHRNGG